MFAGAGANSYGRKQVRNFLSSPCVHIPSLMAGRYRVMAYDTMTAVTRAEFELAHLSKDWLPIQTPPIVTDLALAIRRVE